MFVAGITAVELDEEGGRILDALEATHGFTPMFTGPSERTYEFISFPGHAEAIAWLEEQARTENAEALDKHVRFGVPR
jgi:hypothetical protein